MVPGSDDPVQVALTDDMDESTREKLIEAAVRANPDQPYWLKVPDAKGEIHEVATSAKYAYQNLDTLKKQYQAHGSDRLEADIPRMGKVTVARGPDVSDEEWAALQQEYGGEQPPTVPTASPAPQKMTQAPPPRAPVSNDLGPGEVYTPPAPARTGKRQGSRAPLPMRLLQGMVTNAAPDGGSPDAGAPQAAPQADPAAEASAAGTPVSPDVQGPSVAGTVGRNLGTIGRDLTMFPLSPVLGGMQLGADMKPILQQAGQEIMPALRQMASDVAPGVVAPPAQAAPANAPPAPPPAINPGNVVTSGVQPPAAAAPAPGGGGRGGPGLPPSALDALVPQIQQSADAYAKTAEAMGKAEAARLDQVGQLRDKYMQQSLDDAAKLNQIQETRRQEQDQALTAIKQTLQEVGKQHAIDPDAYWNRMDTGNRIRAAGAIMLSGLGQGFLAAAGIKSENEALGIINDAVKRDVDAQKFNEEQRGRNLHTKLEGQFNVFNALRERGLDEFEAYKAEHAIKSEAAAHQIEWMASQMSSPEAQQKGVLAAQQIRMEGQKSLAEVAQHRDRYALGKLKLQLGWAQLDARKQAIKAAQLRGGDVTKEADLRNALDQLHRIRDLGENVTPIVGGVAKKIPGTAAQDYENNRNAWFEQMGPVLKGGVMRESDRAAMDQLFPHAGEMNKKSKFDALERLIVGRYLEHQRGFGAAGYPGGALPSVDVGEDEDVGFEE